MTKPGSKVRLNARDVEALLASRHANDVFIRECKTGPTQSASACPRMDAWVMRKSWSQWTTIAYEIKVSRGDFLRDEKWRSYLPHCHELYFVAPLEVCAPDELPDQCGLLRVTTGGKRLICKKKAPVRDIPFPEDVFVYAMMCRSRVVDEARPREQFWRDWMAQSDAKKDLGHAVSKKLRQLYADRIRAVEEKCLILEHENARFQEIREIIGKMGLELDDLWPWSAESVLAEVLTQIPNGLVNSLRLAANGLGKLEDKARERIADDEKADPA